MKAIYTLTLLSILGSSAIAGTGGKAPAAVTPTAPVASSGITGSVSAGYDTEYYFRGLWFSSNNAWGSLNLSVPVADKLTLGLGALYTNGLNTKIPGSTDLDYSELDLIGSLNYDAGWSKIGLVFTHYQFFDTFSGSQNGKTFGFANAGDSTITSASDIGLTFAIPVGAANIYLGGYYDFKINETYFEVGADYTFKVSEKFSLVPSVQLGYAGSDYYTYVPVTGVGSGVTHVRVAISAPYKLTDALTITPYIAGNLAQKAREQLNTIRGQNDLFGGVAVSYSF